VESLLRKIIKMNKRTVIANLNKIANELDNSGMFQEANQITNVMKRLSQLAPAPAPPTPIAPPPAPAPVAPPFGSPVVPAAPVPGAAPALGAPIQPAPAAPAAVTTTTKPPYATSAGAQGTPAGPANAADPYYVFETAVYQNALNKIIDSFKNKNGNVDSIYSDAISKFKNPKRQQLFVQQIQRLRSQYFPGQSLKPGK
jgi:hypothetical protein